MNQRRAIILGFILLLAAAPIALAVVQAYRQPAFWPSGQLTQQEQFRARELAEQELQQPHHAIAANEKIYFTKIELLPDSQAETSQREAIVTHYRYKGNQAILTFVDLNADAVFKVEKVTNMPTPLAKEERESAFSLARADRRLSQLFAEYGDDLQIEAKLSWPQTIADPTQPHRNVHLLFRVGRDYLAGPRVVVDLVSETVHVPEVK